MSAHNSYNSSTSVTLTDTTDTTVFDEDIVVVFYQPPDSTAVTTTPTRLYERRVTVKRLTPRTYELTPITPYDVSLLFPTRQELNDQAAIAGAKAKTKEHSRVPKDALVLRSSYQGMTRLPCYRGVRPR